MIMLYLKNILNPFTIVNVKLRQNKKKLRIITVVQIIYFQLTWLDFDICVWVCSVDTQSVCVSTLSHNLIYVHESALV